MKDKLNCLLSLVALGLICGNISAEERVIDPDGVFAFDGKGDEALEDLLARLQRERNFSVYLVVHAGIIGSSVYERACQVRDESLAEGEEGMVVVYDTDQRQVAVALANPRVDRESGSLESFLIPDSLLMDAVKGTWTHMPTSDEYVANDLRDMGKNLVLQLERLFEERAQPAPKVGKGLSVSFMLVSALVATIFWLGGAWNARQKRQAGSKVRFPNIEVGQRLGASYSGGQVREIKFRPLR